MCFHVKLIPKSEFVSIFEKDYELVLELDYEEATYHLNGFGHPYLPVITSEQPGLVQMYRWGLIPNWAKNREKADELRKMTLNATCENLFIKPSFQYSAFEKRCVIIVAGFYENRHEQGGKVKYPYFIYPAEKQPVMYLGGIYSHWQDKTTQEIIFSCSIITTPANTLMSKVHNSKMRMPFVLEEKQIKHWLNPKLNREQVEDMMRPCREELLEAHTISRNFNKFKNTDTNVDTITEKVDYPELALLDS